MPLSRLVALTSEVRAGLQNQDCPIRSNVMSTSKTSKSHHCGDGKRSFPLRIVGQYFSKNRTGFFIGCISSTQMPLSWPISISPSTISHCCHHVSCFHRGCIEFQHERCKACRTRKEIDLLKDQSENSREMRSLNCLHALGPDGTQANPFFDPSKSLPLTRGSLWHY